MRDIFQQTIFMQVITLLGLIGSGKNSVGQYLEARYGYHPIAFADTLKDTVALLFGWPRDLLEGQTEESRQWRNTVDPWWSKRLGIADLTPRWALQNVGTNLFRRHFHEDIWTAILERRLATLREERKPVVVTDARYENEVAITRAYGATVVRIRRGEDPVWFKVGRMAMQGNDNAWAQMFTTYKAAHESEWAWAAVDPDALLDNDGALDDLHIAVDRLMAERAAG